MKPPRLRDVKDVPKALLAVARAVLAGDISPSMANSAAFVCGAAVRAQTVDPDTAGLIKLELFGDDESGPAVINRPVFRQSNPPPQSAEADAVRRRLNGH